MTPGKKYAYTIFMDNDFSIVDKWREVLSLFLRGDFAKIS